MTFQTKGSESSWSCARQADARCSEHGNQLEHPSKARGQEQGVLQATTICASSDGDEPQVKIFTMMKYCAVLIGVYIYSKVGNDEKHTREGYKTKQKRDAFGKMEEIGTNLNVHQAVINYAKEM